MSANEVISSKKSVFNILNSVDVSSLTVKKQGKEGLDYLSWSDAWEQVCKVFPNSSYKIIKNQDGLPYFESTAGAMVYTEVTIENKTLEMWLPVMDGANKAMKKEPYEYSTKAGKKSVEAYTMFDINKAIMRCLTKNLAMFGLGLYIYRKEDLPNIEDVKTLEKHINSEDQILELEALIIESKRDRKKLLEFWKIKDLESADFEKCKKQLLDTIKKDKEKDTK